MNILILVDDFSELTIILLNGVTIYKIDFNIINIIS